MIYQNKEVSVSGKSNGDSITAYTITLTPSAMRALVNMVRMAMANGWENAYDTGDKKEDIATRQGGLALLDAIDNAW